MLKLLILQISICFSYTSVITTFQESIIGTKNSDSDVKKHADSKNMYNSL